jgi:hypothetical protein
MKRKPLQESPSDKCVCGHERKEHYQLIYELDPGLVAKLRKSHGSWFNESRNDCSHNEDAKNWREACHCEKYLDRRHCKIKKEDEVLQYCLDEFNDITVTGIDIDLKAVSLATASRRVALFKLLGLLVDDGWSPRFTARAFSYKFNIAVFRELIEEGIIV